MTSILFIYAILQRALDLHLPHLFFVGNVATYYPGVCHIHRANPTNRVLYYGHQKN